MIGVHEPSYGVLLESMQLFEGEPISISPFIHAKVEPEIAFVFNKEVNGPHVTVAEILAATAYIAPALEIIDSRFENLALRSLMRLLITLHPLVLSSEKNFINQT